MVNIAGSSDDFKVVEKVNILCVDDDPELLLINSKILRFAGYEVLDASAGNECLSLAKREHTDLILTDAILPDVNLFKYINLNNGPA